MFSLLLCLMNLGLYLYLQDQYLAQCTMILSVILISATIEICIFAYEVFDKKGWLINRQGSMEEAYGHIIDGSTYLTPEAWAAERIQIENDFVLRTNNLRTYIVMLIGMMIVECIAVNSLIVAVKYIIFFQIIEASRVALNQSYFSFVLTLSMQIQEKCRAPTANQMPVRYMQGLIGSITEKQERFSNTVETLNIHHKSWQEAVHLLAMKLEDLSKSMKSEKEILIKLTESNSEAHRFLKYLAANQHDPRLDSSLNAIHNALARLNQEIGTLRTEGVSMIQKEIKEVRTMMKYISQGEEK